jgi:tetratricopeptide (TPR) repeat protein
MNSSKFSAYCDRLLEIGWLLAVIVTPLFFNVYSSRVFEPDKLTTLRTVAVLMGVIWLARFVEETAHGRRQIGFTWRTPLVLPTAFTVVVYLVSTMLSVTPRVSLVGSYQRLQGTFTTLSYVVVFLVILDRLRTRVQLRRLVTVAILNSLPISLYGLIQRNGLDPLPWGGDVTTRVASNMGNSIFVAAYLIMVLPLTLGRVVQSFRQILDEEEAGWADILRAAGYIFVLAIQLVAIWFSQSRGPLLGLIAGSYVMFLLLTVAWRTRLGAILTLGTVATTALLVGFLVLVNIPGGPLQQLQHAPWLGRLGSVFDFEGGTGRVRALIWEGMIDLVAPHDPLEEPPTRQHPQGTSDPYNAIRPLVGYGPESVYVAYNRFYPPLLGHHESRTASPDRSHNETLDSLAITGLLGLAAYLWLFGGLFYFGLAWLGLLRQKWQRSLLFGLVGGLSVASVAFFWWWQGLHFFGAALTLGIVAGIGIYLAILAVLSAKNVIQGHSETLPELRADYFLIVSIFSALVAHFVEINFGIAIASTRTTFWVYAAMLTVVGAGLLAERQTAETQSPAADPSRSAPRNKGRRRRKSRRPAAGTPSGTVALPAWLGSTLAMGLIGGFILGTLAFDFVTNAEKLSSPLSIVWRALTVLPAQDSRTSLGALMIVGLTWIISAALFLPEIAKAGLFRERPGDWGLATALYGLTSAIVGLMFALTLASRQVSFLNVQPTTIPELVGISDRIASLMALYYGLILFTLLAGATALLFDERVLPVPVAQPWGPIVLVVFGALSAPAIILHNLRPIQADIVYKQADPYDRQGQWQYAIPHYQHAIELAPQEDFYYLYLGRAYLEYASTAEDAATRDAIMRETERTLLDAREINPLNTDHSANLARMYRRWAEVSTDEAARQDLFERSSRNYAMATSLSPHNAILWNEWSLLYYYGLGDLAGYQRTHDKSMALDPEFDQTWLICGDVSRERGQIEQATRCYAEALKINPRATQVWVALGEMHRQSGDPDQAIAYFREAIERNPDQPQLWRVLADTYISQQQWDLAIAALREVVALQPTADDIWNIQQVMAQVYLQIGQQELALEAAETARALAPDDQRAAVDNLIAQIQSLSPETSQQ